MLRIAIIPYTTVVRGATRGTPNDEKASFCC